MIKPLLRSIPTLSGNVKIECTLLDYDKISNDIYEANIRGAVLNPLSSNLYQKNIFVSLLNSSYEYDIKKYYSYYSDIFFNTEFPVNKYEMLLLDKTNDVKTRNTDFEYGVKRVSYEKSGCQFSCFAPIYIDSVDDIPEYFKLRIEFKNKKYSSVKYIYINIGANKDDVKNYIYKYLYRYISNIDSNVIYIDNSNKNVVYYGIDLVNGGFTKYSDPTISNIFSIQMPIQMFDYSISMGFNRNKMIMKQCIPLSFYFDVNNILDDIEKVKYRFSEVTFSGCYIDKNGKELKWYDYDWNYDNHTENILYMNEMTGALDNHSGYIKNIMNVNFPSFNDKNLINYQFANKLSMTFNRWKLKYSSDEWPYITNMSWAFSNNQNSNYKYREFPSPYLNQSAYVTINENNYYNLLFPLNNNLDIYNEINSRSANKYKSIINNYCLNWFDIINEDSINSENIKNINFVDVIDDKAYFNGILYNFNKIYNLIPDLDKKIDKFAFIVYPNIEDIKSEEYLKNNVKFVSNVINRNIDNNLLNQNCAVNENILTDKNYLYNIYENKYNSILEFNKSFIESDLSYEGNKYINIKDININYNNINCLLKVNDILKLDYINLWFNKTNKEDKMNEFIKMLNLLNLYENSSGYINNIDTIVEVFVDASFKLENVDNKYLTDPNVVIPNILREKNGYELYEMLESYKGIMLCDNNNLLLDSIYKITSNENNKNLYINYSTGKFDPIPLGVENRYMPNNDNLSETYGNTLYVKDTYIDLSYYKNADKLNKDILVNYCLNNANDYNISYIDVLNTPTNNLLNDVKLLYNRIIESCIEIVNSNINNNIITKYEYKPIILYNNELICNNVVVKQNGYIEEDEVSNIDDNVIYMHPYNADLIFEHFFGKNNNYRKYISNKNIIIQSLEQLNVLLDYYKKNNVNIANKFYKVNKCINYSFENRYLSKNYIITYKYDLLSIEELNKVEYDSEIGLFYIIDENTSNKIYFNIAEKNVDMIKIDQKIFNEIININDEHNYYDLFIYKVLLPIEYDEKYAAYIKYDAVESLFINDDYYDTSLNILYPCFNDVYVQERNKTLFYKNYAINNISEVSLIKDNTIINKFYRYNSNNAKLFISISDDEAKDYFNNNIKIYKKLFNENKIEFINNNDIFGKYNLNIVDIDGIRYGFYLLKVNLNNTNEFLNIKGFLDNDIINNSSAKIDYMQNVKYITYINNINIIENKDYLISIFKQLCPFLYINLYKYLNLINTVIVPTAFNLTITYNTIPENINNNSSEVKLQYNKQTISSAKKQILQRYTDSIVPYIYETNIINDLYNYKLKNVKATLIDTGKYNSIGDSTIYKDNYNINYPTKLNVYSISNNNDIKSYNNVVEKYLPLEFKHYNSSKGINLMSEIIIDSKDKFYSYDNLIIAESEENTYNAFKNYILKYNDELNNDEILFLYKKYKKSYITNCIGVNINNTFKNYTLKYKFTLL